MIPLRVDHDAARRAPLMLALVALNLLAFVALAASGPGADDLIRSYGWVPARFASAESWRLLSPIEQLAPLVSHAFLHQGALHLLVNVWGLWVFGAVVEARLGGRSAIGLYGFALLAGAAAQGAVGGGSLAPMIGASGAVAGLMGATIVLIPRARVLVLVPLPFPTATRVPVWGLVGIWAGIQFVQAAASVGTASGVAWWAHLGGFFAGATWAASRRLPRPTAQWRIRTLWSSAR